MEKLQSLFFDTRSGNYVSKDIDELRVGATQFVQTEESALWFIPDITSYAKINVFVDGNLIIPNGIAVTENSLVIEFNTDVSGIANILYILSDVDQESIDDEIEDDESLSPVNVDSINRDFIN